MDVLEGRIRVDQLDIELDKASLITNKPRKLKLHNMLTFPQKIQLWLIVGLSLGFLITNFTSIKSSFQPIPTSNSTCQSPPRL